MKTKSRPRAKPLVRQTLRIEFHAARAQAVSIAGTFNDWRPGATPMLHLGEGRWVKELSLPTGRYEYRLVVDGQWICDPMAAEKASNPFGGFNAVLTVPSTQSQPATNHREEN